MIPGKGNTKVLTQFLQIIPKVEPALRELSDYTLVASNTLHEMRQQIVDPNLKVEDIKKLIQSFTEALAKQQEFLAKTQNEPIFIQLKQLSQACGTPALQNSAAIPYVGIALGALCVKISFMDLKATILLDQLQRLIQHTSMASQNLQRRMG